MAYQYITFATAAQVLASRLQDPTQIYFNQPNELLNCLIESVRFFQVLTGSYKQRMVFSTQQNVNYYSLSAQLNSPVPATVTDVEVINNVLAALLEPPLTGVGSTWVGTGQFTFAQLQQSLQNRLNRYIGDTGRQVTQQTLPGPTPQTELTPLPDGVLDVRRVAWVPVPLQVTTPPNPAYALGRMDEWSEQAYIPQAVQNPAQPLAYSVFGTGPLQIRMIPPPSLNGSMDCIFVVSGTTVNLNPTAPVVLGVNDDLTPGLKWGVLADLLGSDGPSRDYTRASYAEQRYSEWVQLARIYPSVLTAAINEITCGLGAVFDMDFYQPDWQQTTGVPSFVGMCGRHLACVGQTPDDGTAGGNPGNNYSVGLWLCANAPVTGDIQVSRDQIDPVLDYAQHIASFKMGGAEFDGTDRLFQNMIAAAKAQNGRLEAVSFYKGQLQQPSNKDSMEVQRMIV